MTCFSVLRPFLVALLLFGLIGPSAFAQGVSVKVHWTKDSTVSPSVEECATSGTVGGNAAIHIRFDQPSNLYGPPRLKELRIHENAGHLPDYVVADDGTFGGVADPVCGDNPYDQAYYRDEHWASTAGHNGSHTITVTIEYFTFNYPYGQSHLLTAAPITLDAQNLLVADTVPVNPDPIKWNPETMTSVPVSATISAAYKANQPVTLSIYTSSQTLVKTMQQTVPVGMGATTVSFTWDGTQDISPPGPAPKGLYLFRFEVGTGASFGDIDSDKAGFLSVTQTRTELTDAYDETTEQNTLKDGCVLTDSAAPKADASEANLRVYGTDLAQIAGPITLGVTTNAAGAAMPIWNEATYPLVIQEEETHLFSARDSHADADKGHRQRWALQNNQKPKRPRADCYQVLFGSGSDVTAKHKLRSMGYAAEIPINKSTPSIYELLQYDRVMFYTGGGAYDVTRDYDMYGGIGGASNSVLLGNRTTTVPDQLSQTYTYKFLRTLPSGKLAGLKLAVWLACYTGLSGTTFTGEYNDYRTGNVVDEAISKGAECSVGFTTRVETGGYNTWATRFFSELKAGNTVRQATYSAMRAARDANYHYYDDYRVRIGGNESITVTLPR